MANPTNPYKVLAGSLGPTKKGFLLVPELVRCIRVMIALVEGMTGVPATRWVSPTTFDGAPLPPWRSS